MIQLAGAVIYNENNEILLLHRNVPNRVQWELPGGKIEENENPEEAAIRELKEELNINIKIIKFLGSKDFKEDGFTMKYNWFEAKIVNGNLKLMEERFDKFKYFSSEELKIINNLSENMKNFIKENKLCKNCEV